jgi:hypothetical protein
VAPKVGSGGEPIYDGTHAGHPHWHIDRAALVGPEEQSRSFEALTMPESSLGLEEFAGSATPPASTNRLLYDCSWLQRMHLPARADWMASEWDGRTVPGPHQCQPDSILGLSRWWCGALRYLAAELPD